MRKAIGFDRTFTVAVASGKGGTGKTTIAVALALAAPCPATLLDCDVEEPNAAIFLSREAAGAAAAEHEVAVPIPVVDEAKCTGCGACAKACRFNAIVVIKRDATIFSDLCHSCGGCVLACPARAIREEPKRIGVLKEWRNGRLRFVQGELDVGRAMSPPLIRAVKKRAAIYRADPDEPPCLTVVDCPPGTSCPMTTAVRGADFVLLAIEPTPFGLHDLRLAVETVRTLGIPFGAAINRADIGDDRVEDYCSKEGIPVLARIPNDRRVAEAYSVGRTLLEVDGPCRRAIEELAENIGARALQGVEA